MAACFPAGTLGLADGDRDSFLWRSLQSPWLSSLPGVHDLNGCISSPSTNQRPFPQRTVTRQPNFTFGLLLKKTWEDPSDTLFCLVLTEHSGFSRPNAPKHSTLSDPASHSGQLLPLPLDFLGRGQTPLHKPLCLCLRCQCLYHKIWGGTGETVLKPIPSPREQKIVQHFDNSFSRNPRFTQLLTCNHTENLHLPGPYQAQLTWPISWNKEDKVEDNFFLGLSLKGCQSTKSSHPPDLFVYPLSDSSVWLKAVSVLTGYRNHLPYKSVHWRPGLRTKGSLHLTLDLRIITSVALVPQ